jgi:hypothetical protein
MVFGFSLASAIAPLMSFAAKLGCAKIASGDQADGGGILERVVPGVRHHQRVGDVAGHDQHQRLAVGR